MLFGLNMSFLLLILGLSLVQSSRALDQNMIAMCDQNDTCHNCVVLNALDQSQIPNLSNPMVPFVCK